MTEREKLQLYYELAFGRGPLTATTVPARLVRDIALHPLAR